MGNMLLIYFNQMDFKQYAANRGIARDKYYFDYTTCVNATTDKDIPNVVADGSLTWDQAMQRLKIYFKL